MSAAPLMREDRRIADLFAVQHPLCSLEFFPPKDEAGVEALRRTADALRRVEPDFVSITYGAGGSTQRRTSEMSCVLREEYGFTVMPHLTAVNQTRAEVEAIVDEHYANGIRNIMALRGDIPAGSTAEEVFRDDLRYGADVVALLKARHPEICIGVGGYPETHPEAPSPEADLAHLKAKVDAGADFVTTQLFLDNEAYYRFADRCRAAGIQVPIVPGIMPVLSLKQITRITSTCGASLPDLLRSRLEAADGDAEATETVGIEWALAQIRDLVEHEVPGYHLYILNRARSALSLAAGLHHLR
jgi:methylenetetrahydrofolate reductase (NADPH)